MTKLHKKRNPIAQAPILRKGGVHEKSRKAKRQKQKGELRSLVRNTVSKAMATYRGHCSIWLKQNTFLKIGSYE
jgi:hypothetical protein